LQEKSGRGIELLVLIMASVALIIMVVGGVWTLSPDDGGTGGGGSGHGGSGDETSSFPIGTALFIFGGLLFIILLFAGILLRSRKAPAAPQPVAVVQPMPAAEVTTPQMPSEEAQRLAIKLLSGDERKMFRRIVEGGGEVLQKDLVAEGKFSKAKVTRLLDKLERKDLIVRSRYGSTNKIRISENLGK
jgi:hypothetical protein